MKRQTITCVASASPMICVTGTRKGGLLIWKNFRVEYCVGLYGDSVSPHKENYIQTIWSKKAGTGQLNPLYITGDTGGNIVVWEMILDGTMGKSELIQLHNFKGDCPVSLRTSDLKPPPLLKAVQSVCARDGVLLVATQSSDIYEIPFGIIGSNTAGAVRSEQANPKSRRQAIGDAYYADEFSGPLVVYPEKALRVVSGHMADIWGLVTHPSRNIYFTSGNDSTVRAWSLDPHAEIVRKPIPLRCRSLAVTPDGSFLAMGSTAGPILIYRIIYDRVGQEIDFDDEAEQEINDCNQMIVVIKFGPSGTMMASACYDGCIYVRVVTKTETGIDFKSEPLIVLRGHTGHITHFDFGVRLGPGEAYDAVTHCIRQNGKSGLPKTENLVLQSNDSNKELRYWNVIKAKEIESSMEVCDIVWDSLTCPLCWPVQGIYDVCDEGGGSEGRSCPSISAICRNNCWQSLAVLVAADSIGRIRLFSYPSIVPGSPDKCYFAHCGNISNVVFTHDDSYCVSIGQKDHCVVVWKTDIVEEIRERKALALDQEVKLTTDNLHLHNQQSPRGSNNGLVQDDLMMEEYIFNDDHLDNKCKVPVGGDEFMAIKPWK